MPKVHEPDRKVADEATVLLVHWGRPDLSVTGDQVVRWRQSGVFGPTPRGGGKHRLREYPPYAAEAAAKLAIALHAGRERDLRLEMAILAASGDGARIAKDGIRTAADHVLNNVRERIGPAKRAHDEAQVPNKPAAALKRSQRLSLPGKRRRGDPEVRATVLGVLSDQQPDESGVRATFFRLLGPDVVEALEAEDAFPLYSQVLGQVGLSAIKSEVKNATGEDLARAMQTVRSAVELAAALSRYLEVTGSQASEPVQVLLVACGRALERLRVRPGVVVALTAPVFLIAMRLFATARGTPSPRLEDFSRSCSETASQLRAVARLTETLPPRWRTCVGQGGVLNFAQLPDTEQRDLLALIHRRIDTEFPQLGNA
jgi:hypothetical protein